MTLTINISRDVNDRLQQEAERRGLDIEEYARRLIEGGMLSPSEHPAGPGELTREERLRRLEAHWWSHHVSAPPLADEAVSRESIYGERP